MVADEHEINAFLEKAREYIRLKKIDFIHGFQEKYILGHLGISFRDAFEMVKELTYKNYFNGPSPDRDFPNEEVWEFGIQDEPDDIYIKLKFRQSKGDLLMMSFHYAEKPISYPYN